MSQRTKHFTPLRRTKDNTTYHADTLARELLSRDQRKQESHLKWDYAATLTAITQGQRFPMKRDKAERIARRLTA